MLMDAADIAYAVSFVAIPAVGIAILFLALSRISSGGSRSTVFRSLAALPGSIIGAIVAHQLFWRLHSPTPAMVWYLGGILIGGPVSLFLILGLLSIIARYRAKRQDRNGSSS